MQRPLRLVLVPVLSFVLGSGIAGCGDDASTADRSPDSRAGDVDSVSTGPDPSEPAVALPDQGDEPLEPNATIDRVVDGDTIVVEIQGRTERVRLIGIDTPESVAENRPDQCYGAESATYLASLLPEGTPITLIRDVEARDQFDRLLAYVVRSDDGLFVNLDLVANGYAGPFTYPPNDHYSELLEDAADVAAEAGIGLWGACGGPDVPLG